MDAVILNAQSSSGIVSKSFGANLRNIAALSMASLVLLNGCTPATDSSPQNLKDLRGELGIKSPTERVVVDQNARESKRTDLQEVVNVAAKLSGDVKAFGVALNSAEFISGIHQGIRADFERSLEHSVEIFRSSLTNNELSAIEHGTLAAVGEQGSVVLDLLNTGRLTARSGNNHSQYSVDGNSEQLALLNAKIDTLLWTLARP